MEDRMYTLPGGWVDPSGDVHREVVLSPLTGREEAILAGRSGHPAARVTEVLGRCIRRIGSLEPVPESVVRDLLVADRDFLLLKLREATFGSRIQGTLPCPWPDCGQKVDVDFTVADIPVVPSAVRGRTHTMVLSPEAAYPGEGTPSRDVAFRLPNGADQELLGPGLAENESLVLEELLARCISRIGSTEISSRSAIEELSPLARMEIEREMFRLAPRIELDMDVACPECGREFTAPFDVQDFFFGELRTSRDLLYREVHYLAFHYHWSEKEIMEMPKGDRRNYIEILAEEIERLNSAG